jgi:hypothetical protein
MWILLVFPALLLPTRAGILGVFRLAIPAQSCNTFFVSSCYSPGMRLADTAKLTVDPKKVLESRWCHDTAHAMLEAVRKVRGGKRRARKP